MKYKNIVKWCFLLALIGHTTVSAQTVERGKNATFRAKSTNAQSYEWTFPGGIVINGKIVRFTFTEPGPQEVKLKVVDALGNFNEVTKRVLVANLERPTAIIASTVNGEEFLGSVIEASLDESLNLSSNSFFVSRDEAQFDLLWTVNGRTYAQDELSTVFDAIGIYEVVLTATDTENPQLKDQDFVRVKIGNKAPTVTNLEVIELAGNVGQVQLTALAEDMDGQVESYKFEALKGEVTVMTQVVKTPSTLMDLSRFFGEQNYTFKVTVTDDRFAKAVYKSPEVLTFNIEDDNQAPTVSIGVQPGLEQMVDKMFTFFADADDLDNDNLRYEWRLSTGQRFYNSRFRTSFENPGTYTARLSVSDGVAKIEDEIEVNVVEKPTKAETNQAPVLKIRGVLPSKTGTAGSVFRFFVEASDPDSDRLTYDWDFGNDTQSFTKNAAVVFSEPGAYTAKITVSDGLVSVSEEVNLTVEPGREEPVLSLEARLAEAKRELAALEREQGASETPDEEAVETVVELVDAGPVDLKQKIVKASETESAEQAQAVADLNAYEQRLKQAMEVLKQAERLEETVTQATARMKAEKERLAQTANTGLEAGQKAANDRLDLAFKNLDSLENSTKNKLAEAQRINLSQLDRLTKEQTNTLKKLDKNLLSKIDQAKAGNKAAQKEVVTRLDSYKKDLSQQIQQLSVVKADLAQTASQKATKLTTAQKSLLVKTDKSLQGLIEKAETGQMDANKVLQSKLKAQSETLSIALKDLKAAENSNETLSQLMTRLKQEQQILKSQALAFKNQGRSEEADRVAKRLLDLEQSTKVLGQASVTGENLESVVSRLTLEQAQKDAAALTLNRQNQQREEEKTQQQKADWDTIIKALEASEKKGENLEAVMQKLQAQADLSSVDSAVFKEAVTALQYEKELDRKAFLESEIRGLENADNTTTVLLPLGIGYEGQETLQQRLERLDDKTNRAKREAEDRQRVAADLALLQQGPLLEALTDLQKNLEAETDEEKKIILAARIEETEQKLQALQEVITPTEALSTTEIAARQSTLQEAFEFRKAEVIAQQQDYIASRLIEVQKALELATDAEQKTALLAEQKQLQANALKNDLVVDYESGLKADQAKLNQRLAGNLNSTAELLTQTELDSIETKLKSLEALQLAGQDTADFMATVKEDPNARVSRYLQAERESLQEELALLQAEMSDTDDAILKRALALRESEILDLLSRLPLVNNVAEPLENLLVTQALDYLAKYEALARDEVVPADAQVVQKHAQKIRYLSNPGYKPQTRLSSLLLDLQRREQELLEVFRTAEEAAQKSLKTKLLVLAEAQDQLKQLEEYGVSLTDTVFRASEQLQQAKKIAKNNYLQATSPEMRIVETKNLETIEKQQRWLDRFYNAESRGIKLGQIEKDLINKANKDSEQNLTEFRMAKAMVAEAIEAQIKVDFENFKTNLKRQALKIGDETEKEALNKRIENLSVDDFTAAVSVNNVNFFETLLADITINNYTGLFLYADTPLTEHPQPLLFEWNMGDGEIRYGQNINHEYYEPGFYRVALTMSDGVTSQQDLFTIRVISETKP